MSDKKAELSGPDLAAGVPVSDIPAGRPLLGHAAGEAVIVARDGGEVFALGATCSHYGGPLAEGIVVDGTVRCPWHHACFGVRSGRVARPPALNPVACFAVETRDGLVRVTGRREAPVRAPQPIASPPSSVVILGGGAAGHAAAETLRDEGYAGPVTLVSDDTSPPYDRPNCSKDYLAGTAPEEWMSLRPASHYAERHIELVLGTRASALDTGARTVTLADGRVLPFGALLIATGAEPIRLPIPGADLPHVHTLRSLADSRAIIAATATAKRCVVLGSSFIGLEAAASMRARGLEVTVVGPDARPLERVLGPGLGDFVRRLHEEHGVVFRLGTKPRAIEPAAVVLESGESLPADLVIMGVGVRPRIELAEKAGLAVDRGIRVGPTLETSVPGIFAAGDVARYPDHASGGTVRVEHWVVAQRQGALAARNMLGRGAVLDLVPFFWSQHYDLPIAYVGHAESSDEIRVDGSIDGKDCRVEYLQAGRLQAVASIYRDVESLDAEARLEGALRPAIGRPPVSSS